ncbi:USP6 N-terminal-like protein isoform X1 [Canis lupus familiaris]|uniref:USP6 N-terminal-like protein isoform X1 n=1 Tax=Canis lupus familiaris TaxID=9615 RepID=UPI0018F2C559|nr:USP6 N-terminal-like protein isoform X1 [Canis lupus familiaris]XP_038518299.1 USP6 N-terminal-like protein isoform X1 [Canis lupus familiaris]
MARPAGRWAAAGSPCPPWRSPALPRPLGGGGWLWGRGLRALHLLPSRDKELPGPSPREAKKLRQETRRADKWIKMLKRWDHYLLSEKLRCRVYKVVPPQVRGQVWLQLLNVQVKARNAGKYQEMKEAALVSSQDIMQIDLDVNRTFRSHTMFWDRYGVGRWATARA